MGNAAQNLSYEMSYMTFSPQSITPVRYRHAIIDGEPVSQMIQMDSSRREIVQKAIASVTLNLALMHSA